MKTASLLLALILATLLPEAASAQTSAFTYQGQLKFDGIPANGVYDFRFRLMNDPLSGTAAPVIPVNLAVTVSNGLFTTIVDFGAENFSSANRWLEINVRTNGGGAFSTLSPRQQITSTPYAVQSAKATSASSVSGFVLVTQLIGKISSDQLAAGAVTAATIAKVTVPQLLTTITNPTPTPVDLFGWSVAAVGTDRLLVGALLDNTGGAGAAYLFNTDGALLTTFTNPTPAYEDYFGASVAAVGTDRVLIGAYRDNTGAVNAGAAYLFSTSGALLTTFTNPAPAEGDWFGHSLTALGSDRVVIGAWYDNTGAQDAGAAYLFSTNGTLLTTFTNPSPAVADLFGWSVAGVGNDLVLIGAPGDDTGAFNTGAAYLFYIDGTLITTFTNPTPAVFEDFGLSVAALGTDEVLIGAPRASTGGIDAGAVYRFSISGTLLTTFTNPTPASFDNFGNSLATVGTDRVLIGAYNDNTGANDTGAAYMFSTSGALLTTFTNPTPVAGNQFGTCVSALGTERVLIGAAYDDTGAAETGAAFLFNLDTYTPGLIADGVNAGSITTTSLEDGAVTLAKLDPTIGVWTRAGGNVFRPTGNVGIGTSSFTSNRLEVAGMVGATAFNTTSDRTAKQGFSEVDAQAVLAKVAALPITQWSFKEFPGVLHLGPVAQDFHATFGLGGDDKSIATVDADGVALAAIQGLNQKLEAARAENTELTKRLEKLEALVRNLSTNR